MDYQKHYNTLIERSKARVLEGYVEKHHIIPKCLGGTDDKENLVLLTPEEHFLAHQLLVKIYPDESGLAYAAKMMCVKNPNQIRNNKLYGWLKKQVYLHQSKPRKPYKKETKPRKTYKKETVPRKKRTLSEDHKLKIGLARKGQKHSAESIEKIRKSNIITKSKKL
jgi:hypothetical protein